MARKWWKENRANQVEPEEKVKNALDQEKEVKNVLLQRKEEKVRKSLARESISYYTREDFKWNSKRGLLFYHGM